MTSPNQAPAPSPALRVLIAGLCAPFWISGFDKLLDFKAATAEMLGIGMSYHPGLIAWAVIVVQLGGSAFATFARGAAAVTGALALAAFTVAATGVAHAFWTLHGPARFAEVNIFLEHVSIVFGLALAAWAHARGVASPAASLPFDDRSYGRTPESASGAGPEVVH